MATTPRIDTTLTVAQHNRLDRLAEQEPGARVIGWSYNGPLVARPNGKVSRITPLGRLATSRTGLGEER